MARPNRGGDKKRVSAPIWTEPEPGTRRTKVTREQIAQAAFAIADSEGIEAVSMRRIADELGVGTMTLYYYVRTKDDLLALMDDALMAETLVPPDSMPKDWRAAITAVARASRDAFIRHPWSFQMTGYGIGPNGMRHMEQSMRAVESLGLDHHGKMEILAIVDDFVFGYSLRMSESLASTIADPRAARSITKFTNAQLATGEFPLIEALIGDDEPIDAFQRIAKWMDDEHRFDVGLEAILDGFEARLARKKKR
ncbi:MAG: TetR/AcrR family transcriptional regulator [Kofleriaceae bacterium]|nr:TetR/AcrR family transcriptional regulator [Kofleriaceae bacterium]